MSVYTRIFLIGGPNVSKHLQDEMTRLSNEIVKGRLTGKGFQQTAGEQFADLDLSFAFLSGVISFGLSKEGGFVKGGYRLGGGWSGSILAILSFSSCFVACLGVLR